MTTTLSEGVKVPDVGSTNWAGDLEVNWNLLNGALANLSGNVKTDRDNTWTGEQSFTLPIVGSITGTASKAIADEDGTSIKTGYVNVAGNQTVSGDKSFTGSNTFNNILPNATNTYSLGSSSYQWSSVYAQTYYYNGTAWGLDKANTWTTDNKFQGSNLSLQNGLKEIGSSSSAGHYTIHFKDKNSVDMGYISHQTNFLRLGLLNKFTNGAYDPNGTQVENYFSLYVNSGGTKSADILSNFIPGVTNLYNLGTSTNKWKTLNSINPGALSLPDASAKVQIDIPASWVWDGTTENSYVAPITGWLAIGSNQATYVRLFNSMSLIGSVIRSPISSDMRTYIPMLAGDTILISGITSSSFLIRIYPCLGNV